MRSTSVGRTCPCRSSSGDSNGRPSRARYRGAVSGASRFLIGPGERPSAPVVERGLEPIEVGRPEHHAISRGDVDEIEVDSGPGDLASQIRQHAGAILDIDDDDLALAGDG